MKIGNIIDCMTQINSQGQITIPPEIKQQLGLLPGTEVQIDVIGDSLQLRKKPISSPGAVLVQRMQGKATSSLTTNEIMQLTRGDE